MSKLKLASIISVLLAVILLMSSCDIGDVLNPDKDTTTEPPSQTTSGEGTTETPNGECKHKFGEWEVVLESTCTQKGKQVRVCSLCMHIENSDIDLKAHTVEALAKIEPTCTTEGKTEGEKCSVCQTVLKAQEAIATIAHNYDKGNCTMCGEKEPDCIHNYGEWNIVKNATCSEEGSKERSCTLCGNKEQDVISKSAHTEIIDKAVDPTCTETGLTEGKHCSICMAILINQNVVPTIDHIFENEYDDSCNECGYIRNIECAHTNTETIKGYDATCTKTGLTDGVKCQKCGEIITKQEIIPTKKHTEVIDLAVEPTCTEPGLTEGKHCSVCNQVLTAQETVKAKGHSYTEGVCHCGAKDETYIPEIKYSEGLEYTLSADKTYYIVTGIGECADTNLIIAPMYNNLPVQEIGEEAFYECATIENVILPEGIISIEKSAFSDCDELISISLPKTLREIGDNAFAYSSDLKSILIPEGVTVIGYETFRYCYSLENVVLPDSVIEIGAYAFCHCDITEIDLPDKLEIIGEHAFYLCDKLQKITIPGTVTQIGKYAFWDCESLTQISIEEGVKTIDPYAFYGCSALTDISIPSTVESIGTYAFADCEKIKSIILPENLKSIGIAAFYYCSSLESITIPNNIKSIENLTFNGCKLLVSVKLPNSVKKIGNSAFAGCEALAELDVPDELTNIGDSAFWNCKSLKSLEFPKNLQSFSKTTTQTPFSGCSALESITIHVDNPYYVSYKNCIIEKASKTVIFAIGVCELPNDGNVEKIADDALRNLDQLTSIRIPDGTVSIGNRVFYDCNNLKEIVIPNSVQTIGYYAFMKCNNLETIIFMGTEQEWANIFKGTDWDGETGAYTIKFIDEDVPEEKTYAVTFTDFDGTILSETIVNSGESAKAPTMPTRNGYRFIGWDKSFDNVTTDLTVTAMYVQQFTVVFHDYDGTVLKTEVVDINTSATPPANPLRAGYTFTGWSGTYTNVAQNQNVTATYSKNEVVYTVTFKDHNGNVLKEQKVAEGRSATAPSAPARDGYRFIGWDKSFENVISDLTVNATYIQQFTVIFKDYNGTILKTELVDKGSNATPPSNPTRDNYIFNGWDGTYTNISESKTITATYVERTSNYTVTFVDYDGTVLKTQTDIVSGASATAPTAPSKVGYRFVGWDQSFDNVTSDITVMALYVQQFKVSFVDYNGTLIKEVLVDIGSSATPPANPSRNGYTFNGWRGIYSHVYTNQTVQATYIENSTKATLKVTNGTGIAGETISLYVDLSNNSGFISASLLVDFDDSALKLIAVKDFGIIPGAMHTEQRVSPYVLTWENDERTSNITTNGRLVELVFEISPNAAEGVYDITLSIPRDGIINSGGQSQTFVSVNGFIAVSEGVRDIHKWDKGTIITEPTENSTGLIVYTCRVCGETKTEILDKLTPQATVIDFALTEKSDEEDE